MNTEQFIQRAREIHGDRYDYSNSVYHYRKPISIKCKLHGDFTQRYDHHIGPRRSGCRKCYDESLLNDASDVLSKMITVHGGRYTYPHFEYVGMRHKISIRCSIHGVFKQTVAGHIKGNNCPKCYRASQFTGLDDFVNKAKQIHSDKYCYDKSVYVSSDSWLTITCPIHGDYQKTPENHCHKSKPQGCPKCVEYNGYDNHSPGYLYLFKSKCEKYIKVGISNNPRKRIEKLRKSTPFTFDVFGVKRFDMGSDARVWEKLFHNNFKRAGLNSFDGCTEWLLWDAEMLTWFNEI